MIFFSSSSSSHGLSDLHAAPKCSLHVTALLLLLFLRFVSVRVIPRCRLFMLRYRLLSAVQWLGDEDRLIWNGDNTTVLGVLLVQAR